MLTYRICYEIVTLESAEHGDAAERGFLEPTFNLEVPIEEAMNEADWPDGSFDRNGGLQALVDFCRDHGIAFHGDADWGYSIDPVYDCAHYEQGEHKTYSVHIEGVTGATYDRITRLVNAA